MRHTALNLQCEEGAGMSMKNTQPSHRVTLPRRVHDNHESNQTVIRSDAWHTIQPRSAESPQEDQVSIRSNIATRHHQTSWFGRKARKRIHRGTRAATAHLLQAHRWANFASNSAPPPWMGEYSKWARLTVHGTATIRLAKKEAEVHWSNAKGAAGLSQRGENC